MQKVRTAIFVSSLVFALLLASCENIFAPPKPVPPPPLPEDGIDVAAPVVTSQRVYLVSSVDCAADQRAVHFTLYNPTDATLSLAPASSPTEQTLALTMNGQPLRNLPTYCGKSAIASRESLDCVRSLANTQEIAGFVKHDIANAGSSNENTIEARAPGYATAVTFECGGNRPTFALTELGCADGALQFGVRNIFGTQLYLGTPVANGTSQYEYLHVSLNDVELQSLDQHCNAEMLATGETANCMIVDAPKLRSGMEPNGLPETNTVTAQHKKYAATAAFPCG